MSKPTQAPTLAEIVACVILMAIGVFILLPKAGTETRVSRRVPLKNALMHLVAAEESLKSQTGEYTDDLKYLEDRTDYAADPRVSIVITLVDSADVHGFRASALHDRGTDNCRIDWLPRESDKENGKIHCGSNVQTHDANLTTEANPR